MSHSPSRNVLLILTDQHRYDILGLNGSTVCRSPSLDSLGATGVNFTNAQSICALCTPARASIYTGLLPHRHGLTRNVMVNTPGAGSIPPSIPTIAERLNALGYHSHFVGKWHAGNRLPTQAGFTGFDAAGYGEPHHHPAYQQYLRERGLPQPVIQPSGYGWAHRLTLAGKLSGPEEASVDYFLAEETISFLQKKSKATQPFFLALNFWGPHAPYLPSEPYASMYNPDDIEPWPNFEEDFRDKPAIYRRYRDAFIGEGRPQRSWQECAAWAALYFGLATQIDAQIGRVLTALDRLGLSDSTTVIFSADHGDLTGAHGGMHDKTGIPVQELYHIPFIARLPGGAQNQSCDLPISNMDLPKTILDLAGCPIPKELDGKSLLPVLEGKPAPADWPDYSVGEFFGHHFSYEMRLIVHRSFKYAWHPGSTDELYDLENDPWELNNLIASPAHLGILRECRVRLIDWAKETQDATVGVLCGLFHARDLSKISPYSPNALNELRAAPTELLA